ncbi:MAG TPA: polysaccharide deacetylase family protein [Chthoniobacterales bacterium]|nr:polysaccharide deacetylase family protein [Chthoniobacterales bacterium]
MNGALATSISPILAGAAAADRAALVVSLHDVAPATVEASRKMLSTLSRLGVRVTSLLVVPDYHRQGRSVEDPAFVAWLRAMQADGHEVVIHGYFHMRPRQGDENWRAKFITRFYTQDEGEFHDLSYEEAFARITRARDEFAEARVPTHGFIAPAWLLSAAGEKAARAAGMQYTTRLASVRDLVTGRETRARSLVYSARNAWRRNLSLCWNKTLCTALGAAPLVRLSIHPCDIRHHQIWMQITRFAEKLASERRATTYYDWVRERRVETIGSEGPR